MAQGQIFSRRTCIWPKIGFVFLLKVHDLGGDADIIGRCYFLDFVLGAGVEERVFMVIALCEERVCSHGCS